MIKWIFFDVGNVILNDDPAMAILYNLLYDVIHKTDKSLDLRDILAIREKLILTNKDCQHYKTVARIFLDKNKWKKEFKNIAAKIGRNWQKHSPLLLDSVPVIKKLYGKYKLGIIANQPQEVIQVLKNHNLYDFFSVNSISQIIGFHKPNNRIFKYALTEAQCDPKNAVMIGDRIDNDIIPAKSIGMKTIWLKLPLEKKGFVPKNYYESLYFESLKKASASRIAPKNEFEEPDFVAESHNEILTFVEQM